MTRVSVIYATPVAMPPIHRELDRFPDLEALALLDEALLQCALDDGGVLARSRERMSTQIRLAAAAGSQAVLVTCNIYTGILPELRLEFDEIKILGVDEPMIDLAVSRFRRVAVVATTASGLESPLKLLASAAAERGRDVELVPVLCEEASSALAAGDEERHDRLIVEAMDGLADVDVALLAQASMTRTLPAFASHPFPVLASPPMAVAELHRLVSG